jgi:hypothetical protein
MTFFCRSALCAFLLGLAACTGASKPPVAPRTSPPASTAPAAQLTVTEARAVFTGFLPEFENLAGNPAMITRVTAGPETLTETFTHGNSGPAPGALAGLRILVPHVTSYPRWFIAAGTSHARQGFLFVLAQQSAGAPWRETAELYDLSSPPQILHDLSFGGLTASGYVTTTPADSLALTMRPADLSAAYALYLNLRGRGHGFLAGGYTTSYVRGNLAIEAAARSRGWRFVESQRAATEPVYAVTLPKGGAIVIFDTRDTTSWTATSAAAQLSAGSANGLSVPPQQLLRRLGISHPRAGLRITAAVIEENLAYVLPVGSAAVTIVVNDGKVIGVAKS